MDAGLTILLAGILYIALFEALFYMRQQGMSVRFAIEGLVITATSAAASFYFFPVNLGIFLAAIYLITMRVRLLTDLGNWFIRRGNCRRGIGLLDFSLRLFPDQAGRRAALINRGMAEIAVKDCQAAYKTIKNALALGEIRRGALYEAAGYYNLGIACRRTGRDSEAVECFREAIGVMPNSIYAFAAERALDEGHSGNRRK